MYIAALNTPWSLVIVPIIFTIVFLLSRYYLKAYRELARLISVTHSPIISNLGETISGATTIRTFNKQDKFISHSYKILNDNMNAEFFANGVRRWYGFRLELTLVTLIIFTSGF